MKLRTLLLFAFSLFVCNISSGQLPDGLIMEIQLLKEYFAPYNGNIEYLKKKRNAEQKHFDIKLALTNQSNDTIEFWLMLCSWYDNFTINNNYILFSPKPCRANYPRIVTIQPNDTFALTTTLVRDIQWDIPCKNCIGHQRDSNTEDTKLGLIFVDGKTSDEEYEIITTDKSQWDILWSNALKLND